MRKNTTLAMAAALALAFAAHGAAAEKLKIGFLPGVVDPFYQVMQLGVEKAAKDLGIDVVTQIPPTWGVEAQTPLLDAMVARGDLNYIITAPTDKDQLIGPLQAAADHGIKVITVDTYLGDGDYVKGPVKFPISYIGSDNVEGGRIAARGLAKAIGGKGTVYINSTNPNVSSVEGRAQGFKELMAKEFPDIKVLGPDFNLDDENKAVQQTAAKIGKMFERAVASGELKLEDLFDRTYVSIPGTNPPQFMTRFTAFTDRMLPHVQEPLLGLDPRVAFCAAVDARGYLPTHNQKFSQPQRDDPVWNAANCRNRRVFDDRTGLAAATHTKAFLLQTYRRDMGGGEFVLMKDASAPIYVDGRHWGGVRMGYRV